MKVLNWIYIFMEKWKGPVEGCSPNTPVSPLNSVDLRGFFPEETCWKGVAETFFTLVPSLSSLLSIYERAPAL